jgi:hypothetical protein
MKHSLGRRWVRQVVKRKSLNTGEQALPRGVTSYSQNGKQLNQRGQVRTLLKDRHSPPQLNYTSQDPLQDTVYNSPTP